MFVYEKIDWLSITFPHEIKVHNIIEYLPPSPLKKISSPIPSYPVAYEYAGAKILLGHHNSGIHILLSGKPLDGLRLLADYPIERLFAMINDLRGKLSRIDLALDVRGFKGFTVDMVYKRHAAKQAKTRLVGSDFVGQDHEIQTLYIGKMNSKSRKFRVYNKGVEQGGEIPDWIRIEYEKRRGAQSTYGALVKGQTIASIIKSAVDFPSWELWQTIVGSSVAIIPRDKLEQVSETVDRIEWIQNSASVAIAKVAFEQFIDGQCDCVENAPIFDTLSEAISAKLRELVYINSTQSSR